MRLLGRTESPLPGATTADDVLQLGSSKLPSKAEKLLGTKSRLAGRTKSKAKPSSRPGSSFDHAKDGEQKSLDTYPQSQQSLLETMTENDGLRTWSYSEEPKEKPQSYRDRFSGLLSYRGSSATGSRRSIRRESSNSTLRSFYDSTNQPLNISQQTSASAVRDMALRKGSPSVVNSSRDSHSSRRPLRSALKHRTSSVTNNGILGSDHNKKSRRLDLTNLFPRPSSSNKHQLSPGKVGRSSSAMTNGSDCLGDDRIRYISSRASRYDIKRPARTPSIASTSTTREKIFEHDIFDTAKRNVRKPPKGIKNWFDGFDISSDEDEKSSDSLHELPADLPSTFSPWTASHTTMNPYSSKNGCTTRNKTVSGIDNTRRDSEDSTATAIESCPSSRAPSRRKGESRLATSRLQDESVLSLSSSDEDDDDGYATETPDIRHSLAVDFSDLSGQESVVRHAESIGMSRPSAPPRQLHHRTSRTYPATASVSNDGRPSQPVSPRTASRSTNRTDGMETESHNMHGILEYYSSPRSKSHTSHAWTEEDEQSADGEYNSNYRIDAARIMAVTDEEMVLLGMMRRKRAAMAQDSFTEGYQQAVKREQRERNMRRKSSHQPPLQTLQRGRKQEARSRDNSVTSDVHLQNLDHFQRLSEIKKEGVDRALKLERFLASEAPLEDIFPSPPFRQSISSITRGRGETLSSKVFNPRSSSQLAYQNDSKVPTYISEERGPSDGVTSDLFMDKFLASSGSSRNAFPSSPNGAQVNSERRKSRPISRTDLILEDAPPLPERRASQRLHVDTFNAQVMAGGHSAEELIPTTSEDDSAQPFHNAFNPGPRSLNSPIPLDDLASYTTNSRGSPVTPTFPILSASAVKVVSSDGSNTRYTFPTESEPSRLPRPVKLKSKAGGKKKPRAIQTVVNSSIHRMGSVGSMNSAGEDVLAAWAELGGGNDVHASRRTRAR